MPTGAFSIDEPMTENKYPHLFSVAVINTRTGDLLGEEKVFTSAYIWRSLSTSDGRWDRNSIEQKQERKIVYRLPPSG